MTYEQIMYEKVLAHTDCQIEEEITVEDVVTVTQKESAIVITNYHDGENVAIECSKCNEVIIDFNRSEAIV